MEAPCVRASGRGSSRRSVDTAVRVGRPLGPFNSFDRSICRQHCRCSRSRYAGCLTVRWRWDRGCPENARHRRRVRRVGLLAAGQSRTNTGFADRSSRRSSTCGRCARRITANQVAMPCRIPTSSCACPSPFHDGQTARFCRSVTSQVSCADVPSCAAVLLLSARVRAAAEHAPCAPPPATASGVARNMGQYSAASGW